MSRKLADVKGEVINSFEGLRLVTWDMYTSIQISVAQTILAVGSRLMKLVERKAKEFQCKVHIAIPSTARVVRKSFAGATEIGDRSPNSIGEHATKGWSASPG